MGIVMKRYLLLTLLVGVFGIGCAGGPTPQNAAEYRKGILKGGFGTSFETYEVNRSYRQAAKILKRQTNKCLRVQLNEQSCMRGTFGSSCTDTLITYRPKLFKGKKNLTLQVQMERKPDKSIYLGGEPPKGGMIIAIIDVLPVSKKKSKVNVYAPSMVFTAIPKAVKHWLNGKSKGCPKLTGGGM